MGTRSITHIHEMKSLDDDEQIVCSFYRHFDGYPEGHGEDLKNWLKGRKLVNGTSIRDSKNERVHNRAGQMAVQLMNFIQETADCEVIPTGSSDYGEEFTYHIYYRDDKFKVVIETGMEIDE